MSKQHVAILGAGLIGRILSLECLSAGLSVSLFDRDSIDGQRSCAYTGAGMLAPYTELEQTEPVIAALGIQSLSLWPTLLSKLPRPVFFQKKGTLVLAHRQDHADLCRFENSLKFKFSRPDWRQLIAPRNLAAGVSPPTPSAPIYSNCDRQRLLALEPDLPTMFTEGIYLPNEGQIDNRQLLEALKMALLDLDVDWQAGVEMALSDICDRTEFDFIIDCRGMGAQHDFKQLRGVRGELIAVEARGVKLNRPIRLMHPRHPIYIVPREGNHFLIGATSIESDDMRPLTVQSALELLSAACTLHPGFSEAVIIESRVNCRPALPDNLPAIIISKKAKQQVIFVNGLYRHGFLLSPKLAKLVLSYIVNNQIDEKYKQIFVNTSDEVDFQMERGEREFAISH